MWECRSAVAVRSQCGGSAVCALAVRARAARTATRARGAVRPSRRALPAVRHGSLGSAEALHLGDPLHLPGRPFLTDRALTDSRISSRVCSWVSLLL